MQVSENNLSYEIKQDGTYECNHCQCSDCMDNYSPESLPCCYSLEDKEGIMNEVE